MRIKAFVAMLLLTLPATAAVFTVTPLKADNGTVAGCLAQDASAAVGFLAVGDTVVMLAHSDAFVIANGAAVRGTYAVDGAVPVGFSGTADSANTASIPVSNDAESVAALVSGNRLTVVANGKTATFDIANTAQAFTGLMQCMSDEAK